MPVYLIVGAAVAIAAILPVAWKWQLSLSRAALLGLGMSMISGVALTAARSLVHFSAVTGAIAMCGLTVTACAAVLLAVFFRDPERPEPSRDGAIVSPADGKVIYVREFQPGETPVPEKKGRICPLPELSGTMLADRRAVAIGISMSLSDVHVNRAPITGRVILSKHVPGFFGSLKKPDMVLKNERATTVIQAGDLQIAIVQIASRLVRRIVSFISEGEMVRAGQRIGAIRFGSQVDLIVPEADDIRLAVEVGDQVTAGRTILAVRGAQPAARQALPEGFARSG